MNVYYYQNKSLVKHSVYISVYIHVSQQMFEFLIISGHLLQPVHAPVLLHLMDFRSGSVFLRWCWIHHSGHSRDHNLSSSIHPSIHELQNGVRLSSASWSSLWSVKVT